MKINSIESVRDFPPFFSDLIVQIRESKLLTNYANVLRLEKELFECIVRYKAAIKLSLIIKYDLDRKLSISSNLLKLRSPDFGLWMQFALCDIEQLIHDESCSKLVKSLHKMNSKWLHASSHKNLRKEMLDLSRGLMSNYETPKNAVELIELLQSFITQSNEHEIYKSNLLVEKACKFLEAGLTILIEENRDIFDYKLCSLQSFVSVGGSTDYFFRAHYGGSVLPFLFQSASKIKIGSVFLMEQKNGSVQNSFEPILCLSPIIIAPTVQSYDEVQTKLVFLKSFTVRLSSM